MYVCIYVYMYVFSWIHTLVCTYTFKDIRWVSFYVLSLLFTSTLSLSLSIYIYIYVRGAYDKFPDFFVRAFKIVIDSWKSIMLSCRIAICNYTSTYACRIHIDAIINTSEDFFKKNIPLTLFERFVCVRGSWRPNRTATYWPPQPLRT